MQLSPGRAIDAVADLKYLDIFELVTMLSYSMLFPLWNVVQFVTGELTGLKKCQYEELKARTLSIDGLPPGLDFTDPWACGRKKLLGILTNKDVIHFSR
jgi:GTF2I-like repeat